MRKFMCFLAIMAVSLVSSGQLATTNFEPAAGIPNYLDRSALYNFGQSYPYNDTASIIVEGDLAQIITLSRSRTTNRVQHALTLVPGVHFRMLSSYSAPLLTPTYKADLRYLRHWQQSATENRTWIASIGHRSNGQDGHIIDGTAIDLVHGNFSTHYISTQYYVESGPETMRQVFGLGVELHFPDSLGNAEIPGGMSSFLGNQYGKQRLQLEYAITSRLHNARFLSNAVLAYRLRFHYALRKPPGDPLFDEFHDAAALPRSMLWIEVELRPQWLSDIAFFVRYRNGQDDYNLYFFHWLQQVQWGFFLHPSRIRSTSNRD